PRRAARVRLRGQACSRSSVQAAGLLARTEGRDRLAGLERQTEGDTRAFDDFGGRAAAPGDSGRAVGRAAREILKLSPSTKRFGSTPADDDVSLDFAPSEIVGVVGENGAGKTTLMSIAAGELRPDIGAVHVDGAVGMVHQHFMLVSEFTIAENLALTM